MLHSIENIPKPENLKKYIVQIQFEDGGSEEVTVLADSSEHAEDIAGHLHFGKRDIAIIYNAVPILKNPLTEGKN